jgi:mono/diheme cytochrome c family protein
VKRIAHLFRLAPLALLAPLVLGGLAGCREQTSDDSPILLERNMYDQERYNPESFSGFFPDHQTMRMPMPGTVARDRYEDDPEVATGLLADRSGYVMTTPQGLVQHMGGPEKLVLRGQERFAIYCAPCHGLTGDGKGMVVCKRDKGTGPCTDTRGFPPLPSYEDPRLRTMPDGQLFATITHGARTMPAYGPQIPIPDRWAIVSYVRALQVSQMAAVTPSQPEPKK